MTPVPNQVRIINKLEQLHKVDVTKLAQALPYEQTLKFNELVTALEQQNATTLAVKAKTLAAEYAAKLAQMLASNEQMLATWQKKEQQALSKLKASLQPVAAKISDIFAFDDNKVTFLTKQLMLVLNAEDLNDVERARERNLRISLNAKDYAELKQHFDTLDTTGDQFSYTWLSERLKVDNSLEAGVAIIEDDYVSAHISFAAAKQKCVELLTSVLAKI